MWFRSWKTTRLLSCSTYEVPKLPASPSDSMRTCGLNRVNGSENRLGRVALPDVNRRGTGARHVDQQRFSGGPPSCPLLRSPHLYSLEKRPPKRQQRQVFTPERTEVRLQTSSISTASTHCEVVALTRLPHLLVVCSRLVVPVQRAPSPGMRSSPACGFCLPGLD